MSQVASTGQAAGAPPLRPQVHLPRLQVCPHPRHIAGAPPRLQVCPPGCRCAPRRPQVHPPSSCRCSPPQCAAAPPPRPQVHPCSSVSPSCSSPPRGSSIMSCCCSWVSVPAPGVSDVCFHGLVSLPRSLQGFWGSRVPLVRPCKLA